MVLDLFIHVYAMQVYLKSQSNRSSIHKAIRENRHSLHFFPHCPRMVPHHVSPQCLKVPMDVNQFVPKGSRAGRERGRGRGGGGGGRQSRLSVGPPPQREKGCLSREELEDWSRNLALPDRELRGCERSVSGLFKPQPLLGLARLRGETRSLSVLASPISNLVSPGVNQLGSTTPLNASVTQKYTLSLSKWVRWQTAHIPHKVVGPSIKNKQFVSLLEFLDLMHSCEGLGESYGQEMQTFLQQEDVCGAGTAVNTEEGEGGEVGRGRGRGRGKLRKRRRIMSESSDEEDFQQHTSRRREEEVGEKVEEEWEARMGGCSQNAVQEGEEGLPTREVEDAVHLPQAPVANEDNGRGILESSCHAIPKPPSTESLDWLDSIEPSQMSTPLPASITALPPPSTFPSSSTPLPSSTLTSSPTHHKTTTSLTRAVHGHSTKARTSDDFQFVIPRTPPSSRRGKPPFVTPLTAPLPPACALFQRASPTAPQSADSVDLFSDISSAALFDTFSETSVPAKPVSKKKSALIETGEKGDKESPLLAEPVLGDGSECPTVHCDLNVTCVPESEGEEEEEEEEEEEAGEEMEELMEVQRTTKSFESAVLTTPPPVTAAATEEGSSMLEDSFVAVHGRRARNARPSFLLTQTQRQETPASVGSSGSGSSESAERSGVREKGGGVRERGRGGGGGGGRGGMAEEGGGRRRRRREVESVIEIMDSSSDEEFVAPIKRVRRGGGVTRETDQQEGWLARHKRPTTAAGREELGDRCAYIEEEAELSQEGDKYSSGGSEDGGEDGYDMEDSFINDNSVLTQAAPSETPGRRREVAFKGPPSMADIYRRSLMSPDTLFRGRQRGRVGRNPYRMVLSQRHTVLQHYMRKAGMWGHGHGGEGGEGGGGGGGRRREKKRLFSSESVSGEGEAEEVMVCYGEEDMEELSESQSIGEPWDWVEEGGGGEGEGGGGDGGESEGRSGGGGEKVRCEGCAGDGEREEEPLQWGQASQGSCGGAGGQSFGVEADIVSPSLLVSEVFSVA